MKIHTANNPYKAALIALASTILPPTLATAQDNPTFAPGDLMLYFLQFGGTHIAMFNLGPAYLYRNATADIPNIVNVGGTLTGATGSGGAGFPTNWYEDPTMFWGAAAVQDTSTSTVTPGPNGDPSRTVYVTRNRTSVGTEGSASSTAWTAAANGSMTTAASGIQALNLRFDNGLLTTTTTLVEGAASSPVAVQNPLNNITGLPGTAYGIFNGGVMGSFNTGTFGTFGGVQAESALDFYRILATTNVNAAPDPTGPLRQGSYEGTFVINQTGSVSFVAVPEPATIGLLASSVLFGLARRRRAVRA